MKTNVPESVPSVPKVSGAASLMATCTRRYGPADRKSTRLNSSHLENSYAVFCLKKKIGALLEQYEETQHTQLRRGELVEGSVVLVDRDEILVDIGGKMEAVIATSEIQNERGEPSLNRGDHVSAVVVVPENAEGRPVISINRARAEIGWRDLQTKFTNGEIVSGAG